MKRSAIDKLVSSTGLVVAVVLLLMGGGLFWAYDFVHAEVTGQLSAQRIIFPAAGSDALNALPAADKAAVSRYAGQQLTTGSQAKVYADNYIAVHLEGIGGGQTYAELSTQSLANPSDQALAGKVQAMFKGETLRGMLLNAYAFDTMATIARLAAMVAVLGAALLAVLAFLGFGHAAQSKTRRR